MKTKCILQLVSALLIVLVTAIVALAGEYQVSRVIDGDTIEVKKGATKLTIRLVGIDARRNLTKNTSLANLSVRNRPNTLPRLP